MLELKIFNSISNLLSTTRVGIEVEPGMIFTYLTFLTKFQQSFQSTCPFKLSTVKSIKKTFVSRETNKINCYKVLQAQLLILFFLMNSNARVKILIFFLFDNGGEEIKEEQFCGEQFVLEQFSRQRIYSVKINFPANNFPSKNFRKEVES